VICRIFHKAVDQYSKMMMVKSPYYHPMDPSSFCFQQEPHHAVPPLPNPSSCGSGLPFHHGGLENHYHQVGKGNDSNGLQAPARSLEPNGSGANMSTTVPMLPPFPSFASIVADKAAQAGVHAGPPEGPPPTWLDGYLPHSGFLYEMGPPAAPS
jgi:hypothetical protein